MLKLAGDHSRFSRRKRNHLKGQAQSQSQSN
ncbi:hypothetical protein EN804_33520 [Mesorhizobium sp. M8A.F.Ca.ET.161.01.1.1]|nr:hypothetical protein EOA31_15895 [Mesorhizobium sp. M4B.F.Ca.ET.049.02.1.2]RUX00548.1 hypothetical protein EOA35_18775 [Mesorhizobium sp. M8A.F.Ca.ET.023.01.1.1]RVD52849.1 hypothetical protein EN746_11130 [Mesorhizobium sp. M8A.F.Ca.ET.023.02.2.1]RWC70534.1 MAG: hypothetical protein EOS30_19370 [Mesorhizobium sp.]TGQ78528.1 hypothetical protein EN850_21225 [Mesorhizobium sp. M8A.F.Ca.ET.207.01.1.1]TGR16973.1 hypothetical protein EN845_31650 [Mesorhizobium sp. M8A.F.Ca.ET.202.01.1.1]TGR1853